MENAAQMANYLGNSCQSYRPVDTMMITRTVEAYQMLKDANNVIAMSEETAKMISDFLSDRTNVTSHSYDWLNIQSGSRWEVI